MICPTCRYNDPPGFVRNGAALQPCPDCGGAMVAHCCDGLTACNDPVEEMKRTRGGISGPSRNYHRETKRERIHNLHAK
jgi:hypothetical protein